MKNYQIKIDQVASVVVVTNEWGTFSVKYIKEQKGLRCFEGEWETIPFVDGNLVNPYSQYSDKYETVNKIITEYNSIQGGLENGKLSYSFY